jgi:tetratricopeptide (TPR) repeat protein
MSPRLRSFATAAAAVLFAAVALAGCQRKTPQEKLEEAVKLAGERQTAMAIIKLEALVQESPDDPAAIQARLYLADYHRSQQDFPRAIELFREVFDRTGYTDQAGQTAFIGLCIFLVREGKLDEALKEVDAQLAKYPTDAAIQSQLKGFRGELLLNSPDEARQKEGLDALRVMMLESEDPALRGETREKLASYHRARRDFTASNEIYEAYIAAHRDDPTTPQLVIAQGLNLRAAGEASKGDELFDRGAAMMRAQIDDELNKDRRAELMLSYARYNQFAGRIDEAERTMRAVMGENPMTRRAIETQFAIGSMYREVRQFDKALAEFERIKRENAGTQIERMADAQIEMTRRFAAQVATQTTATLEQAAPKGS